jgi:hypothetical protein
MFVVIPVMVSESTDTEAAWSAASAEDALANGAVTGAAEAGPARVVEAAISRPMAADRRFRAWRPGGRRAGIDEAAMSIMRTPEKAKAAATTPGMLG